MRTKYVRSLFLCLGIVISLTACDAGNSDEITASKTNKPVSLKVWHYYNGLQQTIFEQKINEFNNTVGVEKGIVMESFSQGTIGDLENKLLASANKEVGAEDMPEIFSSYPDNAYALDQKGLVADLTPYFTKEELSEYREEYLNEGKFTDDTLKIFPVAKSTELLFVNKTQWDIFAAAAGYDVSKLSTIEGLIEVSEDYYNWTDGLTPEANDGKAFFGRDSLSNYLCIGSKQLGKEVFTTENGSLSYQLDEDVFRTLWDNYYVPFIKGYFFSNGKFRTDDMKTDNLIAYVGSTSSASYFPNEVVPSDTETHPIECMILKAPIFANGQPYAVQQGAGLVVSKMDKEKETAASEFLKWFTDTENNVEFSTSSGYLPVKNKTIEEQSEAKPEASPDVDPHVKEAIQISLQQIKDIKFYINPPSSNGSKARSILEKSLDTKSKEDRQAVLTLVSTGVSLEDAVNQYNTHENFILWLDDMKQKLAELG